MGLQELILQITLVISGFDGLSMRRYDPVEDDIRSILLDVCMAIDNESEFIVGGFSQERWPVDIKTDLPILLEQLPQAINAILVGESFDISFYEQGIERSIPFEILNGKYRATCFSWANWQPQPAIEYVSKDELRDMLVRIKNEFLMMIERIEPTLMGCTWFKEWLSGA